MNKNVWGPKIWNHIHQLAINYPHNPTPLDARNVLKKIWHSLSNLPCEECRLHATSYYLKNSPLTQNTYSLQNWVWTFHNNVNKRLGKRIVSYEEYQQMYHDEILKSNALCSKRDVYSF